MHVHALNTIVPHTEWVSGVQNLKTFWKIILGTDPGADTSLLGPYNLFWFPKTPKNS